MKCSYCGKEIKTEYEQGKKPKSTIKNGVVVEEVHEITIKNENSTICSSCGGAFCSDCIESDYKNKNTLVVTNICRGCKEKEIEATKKDCKHKYVKRFIRKDKYFDYYEKECLYCGDKKGIAEPIEKVKKHSEPESKPRPSIKKKTSLLEKIKNIFK